jgi:hypothetical protein
VQWACSGPASARPPRYHSHFLVPDPKRQASTCLSFIRRSLCKWHLRSRFLPRTKYTSRPLKISRLMMFRETIAAVLKSKRSIQMCCVGEMSCYLTLKRYIYTTMSRDSAVGIATGYGLDDQGVGVLAPAGAKIFSSPFRPNRFCGPPSLLSNGYRGLLPWG